MYIFYKSNPAPWAHAGDVPYLPPVSPARLALLGTQQTECNYRIPSPSWSPLQQVYGRCIPYSTRVQLVLQYKFWVVLYRRMATSSDLLLAADQLAVLDSAHWPRCRRNASLPECLQGAQLAQRLSTALPRYGANGMLQGCPHIRSTASTVRAFNWLVESDAPKVDGCSAMPLPKHLPPGAPTTARALIILHGLHRYYRDGWQRLQAPLVESNPHVSFELALLTWPLFVCTDRDRHPDNDECTCAHCQRGAWLRCDGPLPPHDEFTKAMARFYAPVPLVYTQFAHWGMAACAQPPRTQSVITPPRHILGHISTTRCSLARP